MKRTQFYFAYGANTNLDSMSRRCPTAICLGAGVLEGYKFTFRKHADVELANPNDQVNGVVWQLTDCDLDSLDAFEGFPNYYLRCKVWVYSNEIGWIKAWVYTMEDQDYHAEPDEFYVSMCREGYEENNISTRQIDEALERIQNEQVNYLDYEQI